jgi:hypothetical protein
MERQSFYYQIGTGMQSLNPVSLTYGAASSEPPFKYKATMRQLLHSEDMQKNIW